MMPGYHMPISRYPLIPVSSRVCSKPRRTRFVRRNFQLRAMGAQCLIPRLGVARSDSQALPIIGSHAKSAVCHSHFESLAETEGFGNDTVDLPVHHTLPGFGVMFHFRRTADILDSTEPDYPDSLTNRPIDASD